MVKIRIGCREANSSNPKSRSKTTPSRGHSYGHLFTTRLTSFQVIDTYYMDDTDFYTYMIISLLPILFISWIQNLKLLMPFSAIATLFTMICFGGIFYYIFREPLSFSHWEAIGSSKTIPLFFGTVLFAMEAIGMVSTVF